MNERCYACDAEATGERDRRPEGKGLERACERHADPSLERLKAGQANAVERARDLLETGPGEALPPSLYAACKAAGFRLDSHESDLYVEATAASLELLTDRGAKFSAFTDTEGRCWYDVPFAFDPFWQKKAEAR